MMLPLLNWIQNAGKKIWDWKMGFNLFLRGIIWTDIGRGRSRGFWQGKFGDEWNWSCIYMCPIHYPLKLLSTLTPLSNFVLVIILKKYIFHVPCSLVCANAAKHLCFCKKKKIITSFMFRVLFGPCLTIIKTTLLFFSNSISITRFQNKIFYT